MPESPLDRSEEVTVRRSRLLRRLQNALAAALLTSFILLGWIGRGPLEIGAGDDVIYLSLSRSLERGSYREIYRASAPLHTKYPPGYPAWILLVRRATGDSLDRIVVANLVLVALALLLLFAVARRLAGGWLAIALLLLLVLSHGVLWMGGSYYSEALFLLLSTASLASMLPTSRPGHRAAWFAIALSLLAFLTRLIGLSLVLAVGVWLWSRRSRIELAVHSLASTLIIGGWFGYTRSASSGQSVRSYGSDFAGGAHRVAQSALVRLAHRVWNNALEYGTQVLPSELSLLSMPGTHIDDWIWLGIDIVLLATGIVVLWKTWRAAALFLAAYGGALLLWPWAINRLLEPALPLVLLTLLLGAWRVARRLPVRVRSPALGLFVAVLALGAAHGAYDQIARSRQCDRANPYESPACFSEVKRSIVSASKYLREHASAEAVVLSWRPSDIQFLSGRLGEHALLVADAPTGGIARELRDRNIQYVLLNSFFAGETGPLAHALLASCRELRVEARFAPHALLLSTVAPGETYPDACDALASFVRENPNLTDPTGHG